MNTIDFCFWLQGYFEINGKAEINPEQAFIIKQHLNLVFLHEIVPLRESETSTTKEELDGAHSPEGMNYSFPNNDPLARC